MFKKKKEDPRQFVSPEIFRPVVFNPTQRAVSQIGSLADFLLQAVETMRHKVSIESDGKVVEIMVSVDTHKTAEDG